MFKISKKADYALMALTHLASSNRSQTAKEIASFYNFSTAMMAKVMKELTLAGYLKSTRGVLGGYQLAADPQKLTLGDVLKTVDGPLSIVDCFGDQGKGCSAMGICRMHKMLGRVQTGIQDLVNNVSIQQLITNKH